MRNPVFKSTLVTTLLFLLAVPAAAGTNPVVEMTTNLGTIRIELYPDKAPITVKNFLDYVKVKGYDGTIFHRVIPGFMVQGGGFEPGMNKRPERAPIRNEADNGLRNLAGTIAMARTADPHSASNQFFINTADNSFLDFRNKSRQGWGYTVFGKVTRGMDVVRKIEATPTTRKGPFADVPRRDVVIERVRLLPQKASRAP